MLQESVIGTVLSTIQPQKRTAHRKPDKEGTHPEIRVNYIIPCKTKNNQVVFLFGDSGLWIWNPKNKYVTKLSLIILTMALARVLVPVLLIQPVAKELAKWQVKFDMLKSL